MNDHETFFNSTILLITKMHNYLKCLSNNHFVRVLGVCKMAFSKLLKNSEMMAVMYII